MTKDARVDAYLEKKPQWAEALAEMREIMLSCGLEETIKWNSPCYMVNGRNVVGLAGFKNHCAAFFHFAEELKDEDNKLITPTMGADGKASSSRQYRVESMDAFEPNVLKGFVLQAVELAKKPKSTAGKTPIEVNVPEELAQALKSEGIEAAFEALSPGKRRDYADHISGAKQAATKARRLEKIIPMIRDGVGLHDKYRNC